MSPCGLPLLIQWVQLCADSRLDAAITEPWLQGKVIGGDNGWEKVEIEAFKGMLLKLVTSSTLRAHISQVRRAGGSCQ